MTINGELSKLEGLVKDLADTHLREIKSKGAKMTADELAARKEVLESVVSEFQQAYKSAKGFTHAAAEENLGGLAGVKAVGMDDLKKGNFAGAGIRRKKEEITDEQRQVLAEIQGLSNEQDQVLEEISKGMDELKELAEGMHDEFVKQDKLLGRLEEKAEKVQGTLDGVNERMKDALKKMNDRSTNMCMYILCLVILLGLGYLAYDLAKKKGACALPACPSLSPLPSSPSYLSLTLPPSPHPLISCPSLTPSGAI